MSLISTQIQPTLPLYEKETEKHTHTHIERVKNAKAILCKLLFNSVHHILTNTLQFTFSDFPVYVVEQVKPTLFSSIAFGWRFALEI